MDQVQVPRRLGKRTPFVGSLINDEQNHVRFGRTAGSAAIYVFNDHVPFLSSRRRY